MDVYFKSTTGLRRAHHNISKNTTLILKKGEAKLTDKSQIEDVLASEPYKLGDVVLDEQRSPAKLVDRYLSGDEPDKLTTEVLNGLSDEAIIKIAPLAKTKERKLPNIIRRELRNKPIGTEMQLIIEEDKQEKEKEGDALDRAVAEGEVKRNGAWWKDKHELESEDGGLSTNKRDEALAWAVEQGF